jgi:hypothetical protein
VSKQAATFHSLLKPVLGYFVRSFDEPTGLEVISFWNRIAHHEDGGIGQCGSVSGWLTAFCFWDTQGRSLYYRPSAGCDLDRTLYHAAKDDGILARYMGVLVKNLDVPGAKYCMVAGFIGIQCTSSGEPMDMSLPWDAVAGTTRREITGLDSIQPVSGWWVYRFNDKAVEELKKTEKVSKVKKTEKVSKVKKTDTVSKVKTDMVSKVKNTTAVEMDVKDPPNAKK